METDKWTLVIRGDLVIAIVPPGLNLETTQESIEFDTEQELRQYIINNNLINENI